MKNFSNETKNKRIKAILKVILKRYSFIVWLPALLVVSNFIGMVTFVQISSVQYIGVFGYILNTTMGFMIIALIILSIILICGIIGDLIEYLKKGTIVKDFINNVKLTIEALVDILRFFITLPKRIFLRIKDEKRRFNNSVEKEIEKEMRDEFYYD